MTSPHAAHRIFVLSLATLATAIFACGDDTGAGGSGGGAASQSATSSKSSSTTTSTTTSGSTSTGGGQGCNGLCTGAGFASGNEMMFAGNVVECLCSGSGAGISESACDAYCATFGISAMNALLSSEVTMNDKCVCDGTGG